MRKASSGLSTKCVKIVGLASSKSRIESVAALPTASHTTASRRLPHLPVGGASEAQLFNVKRVGKDMGDACDESGTEIFVEQELHVGG